MKRPLGIALLAILFLLCAAVFLWVGLVGFFTGLAARYIEDFLFLIFAFMVAALGLGLWSLDEDARRAAIAFFAVALTVVLTALFGGIIDASLTLRDALTVAVCLTLTVSPLAYLMRPRVRDAFGQIVSLKLGD